MVTLYKLVATWGQNICRI